MTTSSIIWGPMDMQMVSILPSVVYKHASLSTFHFAATLTHVFHIQFPQALPHQEELAILLSCPTLSLNNYLL